MIVSNSSCGSVCRSSELITRSMPSPGLYAATITLILGGRSFTSVLLLLPRGQAAPTGRAPPSSRPQPTGPASHPLLRTGTPDSHRKALIAAPIGSSVMAAAQRLRTVAVIMAGGVGVRAGLGMPKQLARIAGKPIIEHTIAAVDAAGCIDEIVVMREPNHVGAVEEMIARGAYRKLTRAFAGGESRNDTTRLALEQLGDEECKVLFHDAVRPFVDERILRDCVDALDHYGAVDTAIPSADTIIQINTETNVLVDVPPRALLRRGQTPQAFLLSAIRRAYERAARDRNFVATDDCTVVLKYTPDVPIAVIAGSDENMKITESIDVFIADKLFQLKSAEPGGLTVAEREQALAGKTVVVFGGSEGIGRAIAEAAQRFGATAFPFSRSTTGTDIRKRKSVKAALETAH